MTDGSPAAVRDVADRRLPLEVQQRQRHDHQRTRLASGRPPEQGGERPGDQRPEPGGVAADRASRSRRRRCSRARTGRPRPGASDSRRGIDEQRDAPRSATIGHSAENANGSVPPSGNAIASSSDRHERRDHDADAGQRRARRSRVADVAADRVGGAGERREQRRRPGSPARVTTASTHGEPVAPALERERAPDRGQQAERERQPPGEQARRGRRAEPHRAEPGVLAEVAGSASGSNSAAVPVAAIAAGELRRRAAAAIGGNSTL